MNSNEKSFYDEEDCEGLIYEIQSYADRNAGFDAKFVDSLENFLSIHGKITAKQYAVLKNIHKKVVDMKEFE
jgi:hypothetical protein